jgi:hypothetical protein
MEAVSAAAVLVLFNLDHLTAARDDVESQILPRYSMVTLLPALNIGLLSKASSTVLILWSFAFARSCFGW